MATRTRPRLTDESRAARVQALKNERAAIAGRADLEGDSGTVAKRRLGEIDRALAGVRRPQERSPASRRRRRPSRRSSRAMPAASVDTQQEGGELA
jgi:hypothetical protein